MLDYEQKKHIIDVLHRSPDNRGACIVTLAVAELEAKGILPLKTAILELANRDSARLNAELDSLEKEMRIH